MSLSGPPDGSDGAGRASGQRGAGLDGRGASLVREAAGLDVPALVRDLTALGTSVATGESLTAGLVCAALADVPGSSAVLRGGVTTYASDLKASVLGVDAGVLADGGPVQESVALAMAAGAAVLLGADVGVATTGVAGPGPADGHRAGTVVVALARPHEAQGGRVLTLDLGGDRAAVRALAVRCALALLARWVRERRGADGR